MQNNAKQEQSFTESIDSHFCFLQWFNIYSSSAFSITLIVYLARSYIYRNVCSPRTEETGSRGLQMKNNWHLTNNYLKYISLWPLSLSVAACDNFLAHCIFVTTYSKPTLPTLGLHNCHYCKKIYFFNCIVEQSSKMGWYGKF